MWQSIRGSESYNAHRRYRRRSSAEQIVNDAAYIANRLSWKTAAILGAVVFVTLYWAIPAWLTYKYGAPDSAGLRSAASVLILRRAHWFEYIGIAVGIMCAFISVRAYYRAKPLSRTGEKDMSFVSRILARLLD